MLNDTQQEELLLSLFATAELMGQQLTQAAALLMLDDLREYPESVLTAALRGCRIEGGRFTVSAVLKHAQAADGRPGKDEAWSIALAAADESETAVMTADIQQAMTAAQPILARGDKVGARMAFLSAYERMVVQARSEAVPVSWSVSLGFDPNRRISAIESAVRSKLITHETGTRYLADLRVAPTGQDGQAIAGLLTGTAVQPTEANRARWQQLKADLQTSRKRKSTQKRWDDRRARRHLAALKAAHLAKADQLIRKEQAQ
ncbi:hypothetical protein [Pseudomonas capsici]|uniref:hypothetical protein n=1 Tax=Pseudomonas capsici TaxID=2810614 RepID=UPI0021F1C15E|nr:hypothetical protein [Pseudomonas capsici]MCV4285070.1 hypothetical protein [Pseudomonas capsici]